MCGWGKVKLKLRMKGIRENGERKREGFRERELVVGRGLELLNCRRDGAFLSFVGHCQLLKPFPFSELNKYKFFISH